MPGPGRRPQAADQTRRRHEALVRILGVDAALDGVTERRQRARRIDVEPLAAGDADLPLDEIDAGHHLGHRMLDLQPRVHLEEVERRRRRRAGTRSCRRWCSRPSWPPRRRPTPSPGAAPASTAMRRRLLDHLLVPPLDRALALDERHDGAEAIAEQLDLDVTRTRQPALEVHARVAERGAGLRPRGANRTGSRSAARSTTRMPLPPPPATALTTSG